MGQNRRIRLMRTKKRIHQIDKNELNVLLAVIAMLGHEQCHKQPFHLSGLPRLLWHGAMICGKAARGRQGDPASPEACCYLEVRFGEGSCICLQV